MSLEGKNLSFGYTKDKLLFSGLDIEISEDEIIGLQGYSGSGKTTLGKVLAGYLPTFTGSIMVNGKRVPKNTFNPVQMIHQHPEKSINPRWKINKVLENLGSEKGLIMDEFGIKEEWLTRWPIELSGGELQRFCMARAFDKRTKYLIADEITTMLDGITQAGIWKTITGLCEQNKIGLMVISHDKSILNKLCDRVINFNDVILRNV